MLYWHSVVRPATTVQTSPFICFNYELSLVGSIKDVSLQSRQQHFFFLFSWLHGHNEWMETAHSCVFVSSLLCLIRWKLSTSWTWSPTACFHFPLLEFTGDSEHTSRLKHAEHELILHFKYHHLFFLPTIFIHLDLNLTLTHRHFVEAEQRWQFAQVNFCFRIAGV